jgi:excisionase family DNA binding protein
MKRGDSEIMNSLTTAEIMSLEEASRYLRIKRRTLYTLAARGEVPAAKIGGQWRFRRSHLDGLFDGARHARSIVLEGKVAS